MNKPADPITAYIASCPPEAQAMLREIRRIILETAPDAEEKISYRMPSAHLDGVLLYYGAFKHHIGVYPPVRDAALMRETAAYANEKGNLGFPLGQPLPAALIRKIVLARLAENRQAKANRKTGKRRDA